MTTRHAACSYGQLHLTIEGEPSRISMCRCLELPAPHRPSPPRQFYPDYIIATPGYDFQRDRSGPFLFSQKLRQPSDIRRDERLAHATNTRIICWPTR